MLHPRFEVFVRFVVTHQISPPNFESPERRCAGWSRQRESAHAFLESVGGRNERTHLRCYFLNQLLPLPVPQPLNLVFEVVQGMAFSRRIARVATHRCLQIGDLPLELPDVCSLSLQSLRFKP